MFGFRLDRSMWWNRIIITGAFLGSAGILAAESWRDYYTIETIEPPEGVVAEVGGIDILDDGRVVFVFERGEIYIYDPEGGSWSKFADGLHHPLGLLVRSESEMIVTQRPEVTRLRDTTGDGRADEFDVLTDEFGMAGNHSEFNFGLLEDEEGNLYFSPGTLSAGLDVRYRIRGEFSHEGRHGRMYSAVPYRGWILKLTPDGELIPFASGLRNANGLGFDNQGRLFATDNEGDWVGASPLFLIEKGKFYGHAPSLVWTDGWDRGIPAELGQEYLDEKRERPVVEFPHGILSNSPSQPVQDNTGGKFGPFEGHFFIGELNHRHLIRFMPDEVGGRLQGSAARFHAGHGLRRGNNRLAFASDGSLWTGQTERERGWAGATGIHRIAWTGKTPLEVDHVRLTETGFVASFTLPIDPDSGVDPAAFPVERFRYRYDEPYGSPQVDNARVGVSEVRVAADGMSLELILEEVLPGFIYALDFGRVEGERGESVMHPDVWYTVQNLRGEVPGGVRDVGE